MTEQRLLSIEEAARYLGISPRTVRSYISAARLSALRLGRRVLLDRRVLDELVETARRRSVDIRDRKGADTPRGA